MPVSVSNQKLIWGLFAARCAVCREKLIYEGEAGDRSLVGEIAHIVGEQLNAARGRDSIEQDRNDPDNLILLCRRDHKIADDNPKEWTTSRLKDIRQDCLAWLETQLTSPLNWSVAISQYTYLNVPRLDEFAAIQGYSIFHDEIEEGRSLKQLGLRLNALMSAYQRTLSQISFAAISLSEIDFVHESYIGALVGFERIRFRTKNIPLYRPPGDITSFNGDLSHDPHIYWRANGWTFILNIDPRWITTSTAYTTFRPSGGASVFSGFARINNVDYENNIMRGTALAIGLPSGPNDIQSIAHNIANAQLSLLKDPETIRHNREYHDEIPNCDLCGRIFVNGDYMVDGPMHPSGPWANMCAGCYLKRRFNLGVGCGQLYHRVENKWPMVGGYPIADCDDY